MVIKDKRDEFSKIDDWLENLNQFDIVSGLIADTLKVGTKILVAGNGGYSAEASHFVAELVGKYAFEVYIPAISLCDCAPVTSAVSNDMGFENVFAHQVKVLGKDNDIFIGLTTSKSLNIVKALSMARQKGLITVVLCGTNFIEFIADYVFPMQGKDTAEIQENGLKFLHKLAYKAKEKVIGDKNK
jgi:D-sedoheptulose 7-phosphate isomerase